MCKSVLALGSIMLGASLATFAVDALASDVRSFRTLPQVAPPGQEAQDWYWDSVVNLHIDNHNIPVGQGYTAEELAAMIQSIPVEVVQVSAYGATGHGGNLSDPASAGPAKPQSRRFRYARRLA